MKSILFVWLAGFLTFSSSTQPLSAQQERIDEELLAWVHDGVFGPCPTHADSRTELAWWLAQLVPATHAPTSEVAQEFPAASVRQAAVSFILQAWTQDEIPLTWQDACYARLRGHVDRRAAEQIAVMLRQENVPRRNDLLNLLLEARFEDVRPMLVGFVLDATNPAPDRGRVVETLLLLGGRDTLREIYPTITVEAQLPYLRRLFAAWRTCISQDDLPLLEKLAVEGEGVVAQFALQLWAMHEHNPTQRMRIYKLASGSESSYRSATMSALARGGKDEAIGAALIAELNSGTRSARSLARRFIPQFSSEETLFEAYLERANGMSLTQRGQWMPAIASLSLPQASRVAMEWLVEGGWNHGATARNVVRYLERSSEVDSLLATLLSMEDLPKHIRFPLAIARGPFSADARAFLRLSLPDLMPSEQSQVFHVLAAHGEMEDLLLIRDFVFDSAKPSSSRVEGMRALAALPTAEGLLWQLREPLPQDYQVVSALIELLFLSPHEEWQRWALETALQAPEFFDEDEARGLRIVLWNLLAQRCAQADRQLLAQAIAEQLLTEPSHTPKGESWSALFRFESDFPELSTLLTAFARCNRALGEHSLPLPEDFDSRQVASDVLVLAASYLAESAPSTAAIWFTELASRSLPLEDLLRVAGLTASRLPFGPTSDAALHQLLSRPDLLRSNPRAITLSFAPVGIGWVLIHDRLAEQRLLSEVLQQQRPWADLQIFLEGWVEDDVLATAATFAADIGTKEGKWLALQLQQRRTMHLPLSVEVHSVVAKLAADLGELELAEHERAIVRRLSPQDRTSSR